MSFFFHRLMIFLMLGIAPFAATAEARLTVFAAASLQTAMEEVAAAFPGDVVVSYGGSGQIARQVSLGAPADIVVLANAAWMDWLQDGGHVEASSRVNILSNRLVLAGKSGAAPIDIITLETLTARLGGGRLAMGHTQSVPAGIYGRQWLEKIDVWNAVQVQLAETENVRAALALVSRGEVPLGIVYRSDIVASDGVVTLYDIPVDLHDPILYPAARVTGKNAAQASDFLVFLTQKEASDIFARYGFETLGLR